MVLRQPWVISPPLVKRHRRFCSVLPRLSPLLAPHLSAPRNHHGRRSRVSLAPVTIPTRTRRARAAWASLSRPLPRQRRCTPRRYSVVAQQPAWLSTRAKMRIGAPSVARRVWRAQRHCVTQQYARNKAGCERTNILSWVSDPWRACGCVWSMAIDCTVSVVRRCTLQA